MAPTAPPANRVPVTILLFAGLREAKGQGRIEHSVSAGTTVEELYAELFETGPHGRLPVLFAIDECYVSGNTPVQAGAEVAFIPPLGGG